ncbi:Universal stress protein family [gamma proteobacterium IMCC1989]|nr:Universal stress protein family [gamma proteobacterium IMCC1989]
MLTEINTILYATDVSPESESALSMTMSLAEKYQAEVTVLNVVEPINASLYGWGAIESWAEIEKDTLDRSLASLTDQVNGFFDKHFSSDISIARPSINVINGSVAKSVLGCADDINAGLIVLGSNGHGAISELLLGSVADKVVRLSKRPVLLVPYC